MRETPQSVVTTAIAACLIRAGFDGLERTWWRSSVETVQVVALHAIASERHMFLGAGVYLRALGPKLTPEEHECHVRVSGEDIASRPLMLQRALDFTEGGMSTERRIEVVCSVVQRRILPWLDAHSTEARIRASIRRAAVAAWPTPDVLRRFARTGPAEASA